VGKKGIRIANRLYIAPELGARMGYRVHVRHDPHDQGRIVVYNAERSQFVCVAVDPDVTGDDRQKIAIGAQVVQRKHLRLVREGVRAIHREFDPAGLADRMLTAAGGESFVPDESARAAMAHAGPRLIAQRDALDALDASKRPAEPIAPTNEQRELAAEKIAEIAARHSPAPLRMEQCDGYERPDFTGDDFGFFDWFLEFTAAGAEPDARDRALHADLQQDRTFQTMRATRAQMEIA
jgi:hypothetical protein